MGIFKHANLQSHFIILSYILCISEAKNDDNRKTETSLKSDKNREKRTNTYCTNGDIFYNLNNLGHKPTAKSYPELVSNWLKLNVLLEKDLDCNENEWLVNTVAYFCLHARRIFKQHRGKVKGLNVQNKHGAFLNKLINATDILKCNCSKCLQVEALNGE